MKMKIHYWQNKQPHYVAFQFTPHEYYIVKSTDMYENEYKYSLNPKIKNNNVAFDYGYPVIYITKEQAKELVEKLHFVQVHNKNLY